MGVAGKQSKLNFSKNDYFLPHVMHKTCVCVSGGKNLSVTRNSLLKQVALISLFVGSIPERQKS